MIARPHPLPLLAAAAAGWLAGGDAAGWGAHAAPGVVGVTLGVAVLAAAGAAALGLGLVGLAARAVLGPQEGRVSARGALARFAHAGDLRVAGAGERGAVAGGRGKLALMESAQQQVHGADDGGAGGGEHKKCGQDGEHRVVEQWHGAGSGSVGVVQV